MITYQIIITTPNEKEALDLAIILSIRANDRKAIYGIVTDVEGPLTLGKNMPEIPKLEPIGLMPIIPFGSFKG